MPTQTSTVMPPRALHRNRLLFCGFVTALVPVIALATGIFDSKPHPGPLLLSVNDMDEAVPPPTAPAIEAVDSFITPQPAMPIALNPAMTSQTAANEELRWFNGRQIRPVKTITMVVTAYSPDERSCGKDAQGITASGYSVWTNGMKLVAADTEVLPFGSIISVPGYDHGGVVPVLDRGGAIKGRRLDVLYPTHEQAQKWGRQTLEVTVWDYVDGRASDFMPIYHANASVQARR